MARGKHAAQAARQAAESAMELAEKLADKNADLRVRTRRVEADASRVRGLEERIRELDRQVAAQTSPALEREQRAREDDRAAHATLVDELREMIRILSGIIALSTDWSNGDGEFPVPQGIVERSAELGIELNLYPDAAFSRELRRAQRFGRTAGARTGGALQDNRRSEHANLAGKNDPTLV